MAATATINGSVQEDSDSSDNGSMSSGNDGYGNSEDSGSDDDDSDSSDNGSMSSGNNSEDSGSDNDESDGQRWR